MKSFHYLAPTEIEFGNGKLEMLGELTARFGTKALLVTAPEIPALCCCYQRAKESLASAGVDFLHFSEVEPNPTTDTVTKAAGMAKAAGAQVIIGLGGGSSLDTAKAVAVEASHPGTAWDYLHYTDGPTDQTLPVIAVGTTAGTGSQTTPCAVITNMEKHDKSAIWHKNIFPKIAIVDPELTASMPAPVTAQTGFDAFCHNFEAFLSAGTNPYAEAMALDAIRIIAQYLPRAVADGTDREAREQMAWADTLGGLTNASAGVTLPHGLGMQVGGHCPHVTHGQALAAIYPAFTEYTRPAAVEKFSAVGRILDPKVRDADDETASIACCKAINSLLQEIGLWIGFDDLAVTGNDIRQIADCGQVLGDYQNNPRIATIEEMYDLLMSCQRR